MRVIADDDVRVDKLAAIPATLGDTIAITAFASSVALSSVLLSPFELDAEDSDKVPDRTLDESSGAQTLGNEKASGSFVFVREFDPTTLQPDYDTLDAKFQAFKTRGTMAAVAVRRGGKPATDEWEVDDEIDIFIVETDNPRHEPVTGYHKDRVPVVVKKFRKHVRIVAGS